MTTVRFENGDTCADWSSFPNTHLVCEMRLATSDGYFEYRHNKSLYILFVCIRQTPSKANFLTRQTLVNDENREGGYRTRASEYRVFKLRQNTEMCIGGGELVAVQ